MRINIAIIPSTWPLPILSSLSRTQRINTNISHMDSTSSSCRPHAICLPYPAQGHITPMLHLAKLLHHRGFHITFVNTEHNHNRLLNATPDHNSLNHLPTTFHLKTIPDGLPPPETPSATQDIKALTASVRTNCLAPFRRLISELNCEADTPRVSCIVCDGVMGFALGVAEEIGVAGVVLWTSGVCSFAAYLHYQHLIQSGLLPLKDESYLTNGYLENQIDGIPGLRDVRFRDLPCSVRTTDHKDSTIEFIINQTERAYKAKAILFNTFHLLEEETITAITSELPRPLPPIYSIGPLHLLLRDISGNELESLGSNLWKEELHCLEWLDSKEANSVVYVNFGSVTVMTADQLVEFAWGLSNSKHTFLWIIRPDIVTGSSANLPPEFIAETRERGYLASWCSQDEVLSHRSIGGFLTHCGWNSTMESICSGVPMICWPFFSDQTLNCRYACKHWGIGMEIDTNVKREDVEVLVRELMGGKEGREMKTKAMEWKKSAELAVGPGGSSYKNFDKLINKVLLSSPTDE